MVKPKVTTNYRSAVTGKYVPRKVAVAHPKTTVKETTPKAKPKATK